MSLYSISTVPVAVDMEKYKDNSHKCTQLHVQYLHIAMSLHLYVPLMEPLLEIYM